MKIQEIGNKRKFNTLNTKYCLTPNDFNDKIKKHFEDLGYTFEFKKGLTLMDKDFYYLKW